MGALVTAFTIGLFAYAAHANLSSDARALVENAAFFGFGHGIATVCLAGEQRPVARFAICLVGAGTVLFSASLLAKALFHWTAHAAPVGGSVMILGWLVYALDAVRR